MPRHRPLLFTVRYSEKPFRGRYWYVSGFKGEKRIQLWFRLEKQAKAAAANRNAEIKAHGTQVSLSPVDRIQAIAAAENVYVTDSEVRKRPTMSFDPTYCDLTKWPTGWGFQRLSRV